MPHGMVTDEVVTGLPVLWYGLDHADDYGRNIAPEMLLDKPNRLSNQTFFNWGKCFSRISTQVFPPGAVSTTRY
jgi:hypothetical protein